MTDWKWNGSRRWKFDFHAHTPASDDYAKGPDQTDDSQTAHTQGMAARLHASQH